jgi:hypothetical protein
MATAYRMARYPHSGLTDRLSLRLPSQHPRLIQRMEHGTDVCCEGHRGEIAGGGRAVLKSRVLHLNSHTPQSWRVHGSP